MRVSVINKRHWKYTYSTREIFSAKLKKNILVRINRLTYIDGFDPPPFFLKNKFSFLLSFAQLKKKPRRRRTKEDLNEMEILHQLIFSSYHIPWPISRSAGSGPCVISLRADEKVSKSRDRFHLCSSFILNCWRERDPCLICSFLWWRKSRYALW